ncbi:MAG: class II aldolase/adducin family protein [Mycobacterium sp.]
MTITSLKGVVSDKEWNTRVELAAAYRMAYHLGYELSDFGHFSARVPDEPEAILLNPFGLTFDEITASSLVKVNKNRDILIPNGYDLNQAGFNLHGGILFNEPSINSAMHVHTIDGVAVGCQKSGFTPISQDAASVYHLVRYLDYDGVVILPGEGEACLKVMDGVGRIVVLRNHGTLTVGASVSEAFYYLYFFEKSCQELTAAMRSSDEKTYISGKVLAEVPAQIQVVLDGLEKIAGGKNAMEQVFDGFARRAKRLYPDLEA